jgi:hypothetical protein
MKHQRRLRTSGFEVLDHVRALIALTLTAACSAQRQPTEMGTATTAGTSAPLPDAAPAVAPMPSDDAGSSMADARGAPAIDALARPDARAVVDGLPTVATDLPYRARFAQGDVTDWAPAAGAWALCPHDAQTAYCQTDVVQSASFAGNPAWTNYDVRVVAVIVDDKVPGFAQVAFRVQATDRYWAFHVGRPYGNGIAEWELTVHSKNGYGHTNGGGFAYTKGVPFTIHFKVEGPNLTFDALTAKGGPQVYHITKPDLPSAGRIGLGSKGEAVKFLSVEVSAL